MQLCSQIVLKGENLVHILYVRDEVECQNFSGNAFCYIQESYSQLI